MTMKPAHLRWKSVYDRYLAGERYKDIAASMNISPTRARDMAFSFQHLLKLRGEVVPICSKCGRSRLEHKSIAHVFDADNPQHKERLSHHYL